MKLAGAGTLVRRELGAFFLSPVGAIVGAAFLAVQGLSFWGLIRVLANPDVPAPYGAVLSSYFGGTVIYWALLFALVAALTMRLFAEEKRAGTWETLCTSGISDEAIVIAKLGAAFIVYVALWLPTLAFVAVVLAFAPEGAGIDWGPIASAYLGVAVVGLALVAVGALASALTDKQMVAALLSFSAAMSVLLLGEITGVGISARADSLELATGLVRPSTIATYLAVAATATVATYAAIASGRRGRAEVVRRVALTGATGAALFAVANLAGHAPAADLTGAKIHTLEVETREVLGRVSSPIEVLVVEPTIPGFAEVFDAISGVLERIAEAQPLITVRRLDPAKAGTEITAVARAFGLSPEPLSQGGAVVFQLGGRRRLLDVTAVATFEDDPLGAGQMATFWAESAFAQAIAEISDDTPHVVCEAIGLGGLPMRATDSKASSIPGLSSLPLDWATVAELLQRDGVAVRPIDLALGADGCDAVAVVGPGESVPADVAVTLSNHIKAGGGVLVAVRSEREQRAPAAGLELVLGAHGLTIDPAIVIDAEAEVGIENLWQTEIGYGDHPITRPFSRRRVVTVWPAPRAVRGGTPLVFGSPKSWAETDIAAVFGGGDVSADTGEQLGNVSVAAANESNGARLVVLGSAEAAASQFVGRDLGAGHILAARALRWLVGREVDVEISDKSPEHVRLVMGKTAETTTWVIAVVVVPGLWLLILVGVNRRRCRG